jgi:hypothetical protein
VRGCHGAPVIIRVMMLETALRMPHMEAACITGNKFLNVSCATMFRAKKLILFYCRQSGIKTRCV